MIKHFKKQMFGGSCVYTCRSCGKRTRETGGDESGVELCLACYEDASMENDHNDTGGDHDGKNRKGVCYLCDGRPANWEKAK